ncbi:MAG: hypothetical protein GXO23_00520 [Crenarchaeota archaeon]|nr:hypothetical protein [Thermoproteota archaeon]
MSISEELSRGLSKLSIAALLRFVAAILFLITVSIVVSVLPYVPRFLILAYELRNKMIPPTSLPSWFYSVYMKLSVAGILSIISLIVLAVSAYAFLWPAFSALSRGSVRFKPSNILVKVGLLGYTFTLIGSMALSQVVQFQAMSVLKRSIAPLEKALLIRKIALSYIPIFTTLGWLEYLFSILVIAGICIGLAVLARITGSKIHYVSLALLAVGEVLYIVSGISSLASYMSVMSAGMHISSFMIGVGVASYIFTLVASFLIFIGCRADIPKVKQLEETMTFQE